MQLAGRLDRHLLESSLLRNNPLSDPADREVFVYVPEDYERSHARLPVVMVLPGYGGTHYTLLNYDVFGENIVQRFDRLVRTGRSQPALLVLPDANNRWGGSQFVDSGATGSYQSYLADEVFPLIDRTYRTRAERGGRAIVGRSSGGFGALRLGLDRPDVCSVIGSHAGDSAFNLSIQPALVEAAIAYDRAGGVAAFAEAFLAEPGRHSFMAMMILAYSAAYAPEPDAPFPHVALPFDELTGELRPDVWERFTAHDPLARLQEQPGAMNDFQLIFLDAGDRDEHGLQFGARRMAALLKQGGARVYHEEFFGTHRGTGYRYDVSLPQLVAACYS